jgi:hypothetical protein
MPTWNQDDFADGPNEDYWKKFAAEHSSGASFNAPPPRSAWDVFMDSIHNAMSSAGGGLNAVFVRGNERAREEDLIRQYGSDHNQSPAEIDATLKQNKEQRATSIKETRASRELRMSDEQRRRSRGGSVGAKAAEIAGDILGDINPTYAIGGGGSSALARIIGMGGVTGANDLVGQGDEFRQGISDHIDPLRVLESAAGGMILQGGGEAAAKVIGYVASRMNISAGARMGNYGELLRTMMNLEGGGTIANPKISPKGAKGPAQVMDATARDPGYGIKPWDGKTEADRFRVGTQYLAALNHEFGGDSAKVLAAYNAGPNAVKHLIRVHGDDWAAHLPGETKKYISSDLRKMGKEVGPENLGQPDIVAGEQPSIDAQANANQKLAPTVDDLAASVPHIKMKGFSLKMQNGLMLSYDPEFDKAFVQRTSADGFGNRGAEIHDIAGARNARENKMNDGVIDENLDMAHKISRGIDSGHITPEHLPNITAARDNIQGILDDFHDSLSPEQRAKVEDNLNILNHSLDKLGEPIADKVPMDFEVFSREDDWAYP